MSCVKNCSSVAARISLENRIFDFKAYSPYLIDEKESQVSDEDVEENSSQASDISKSDLNAKQSDLINGLSSNEKNFYFTRQRVLSEEIHLPQ